MAVVSANLFLFTGFKKRYTYFHPYLESQPIFKELKSRMCLNSSHGLNRNHKAAM